MLDTETKRRIDTARDILVGKVPDPKSQVEQITIALIYKFMDDMDKEAISFGGKATFFTGEYEQYSWTNIFDTKVGGHEMLTLYGEAIVKLNLNPNIPQLFRDIFKNAYLPYRDPETLKLFLKTINEFHYDHSEKLGDAFEYLLSVLGSQGDAGQFRTPRHIIDFIVEILQPKKNESILDPACGTAGFLISSYKHILQQNTKKTKGDLLTPDNRNKMMKNFVGYDISPDMVRLSLVNLYLHGFTTPSIYEYDTLTSEDRWSEYYDVILANPPFMSPKGGIKPHKKFTVQANRSEVLFVDYIAEHIHPSTGRAGVIVPEGIIFKNETAYKALRKMLVDKNYLYAIVSLPAGIFNPYSPVKTSILLMDKTLAKKADDILFVKIDNDGFDLGAQRRANDKNDLTGCLELLQRFKQALQDNSTFVSNNKNVFLVEKKIIGEKDDYNLSIDRYRVNGNVQNSEFEMVRLGDLCDLQNGYAFKSDDYIENSNTLNFRMSNIRPDGNSDIDYNPKYLPDDYATKFKEYLLSDGDVVIAMTDMASETKILGVPTIVKKDSRNLLLNQRVGKLIQIDSERVAVPFLKYVLSSEHVKQHYKKFGGGGLQINIGKKDILEISIPLPSLSFQKQVISKVESYQKIIDGAKQVSENYYQEIIVDPSWEMIKLVDVLEKVNENINPQDLKGKVKYIGLENIESNSGTLVGEVETAYSEIKSAKTRFSKGDLLYGKLRPNLNKVYLTTFEGICSTDIFVLRERKGISDAKFYAAYLRGEKFNKEVLSGIKGAQLPRVGFEYFSEIEIPVPHISVQQEIVKRIEEEQALVNSTKKLIEIFEQKIKDEINKLWQTAPKEYAMSEEKISLAAEE